MESLTLGFWGMVEQLTMFCAMVVIELKIIKQKEAALDKRQKEYDQIMGERDNLDKKIDEKQQIYV